MAQGERLGGIVRLQIDGEVYRVVGDFTFNDGQPMREGQVGSDEVHGYIERPQIPYLQGQVRDSRDLDVAAMKRAKNVTASLELSNGKLFVLYEAWFASEGEMSTAGGEIDAKWEGMRAEII